MNRHLPGLDGLRGIAVLGVLAFHSRWEWAGGGFLGVSLFFTLSGFLITRLLVIEHGERSSIDLRAFFARRARRLLPAAFAAIALAVAVTAAVGTPSQARDLPRDVLTSSFYVANWNFLLRGSSYATLFDAASPLQHMWSLAIEEQLYLVVPLLLTGLLAAGKRRRALLAIAGVSVVLAGVSVVTAASGAVDTLYYGTHVRAVELLVGVLLALAVTAPDRRAPAAVSRYGGPLAMGLILVSWTTATSSDRWMFRGPLIVHALLVAVVLWSVIDGVGILARALSWQPLEWLGRRSYGIYVFHWPLFILFEQLPSPPPRPLAIVAAWAATMALAALSYRMLEQPIRTGASLTRARPAIRLAFIVPALLAVAAVTTASAAPEISDPVLAAARLDDLTASQAPVTTTTTRPAAAATTSSTAPPVQTGPPPRLAIFGDSTAAATGLGLAQWALETGTFEPVPGVHVPGCSLVSEGSRDGGNIEFLYPEACDWRRSWPDAVAASRPDVVVISSGGLDALPWSLPGIEGRVRPGDEVADRMLREEIAGINELMVASGARVVWLTLAPPVGDNGTAESLERINQHIRDLAALHPTVDVLDFAGVIIPWPYDLDKERRSDGVHLDEDASLDLARTWLGPELYALVSRPDGEVVAAGAGRPRPSERRGRAPRR